MMSIQAQLALWVLFGAGGAALIVMAAWDLEIFRRRSAGGKPPVPDAFHVEAMREVDALTPACPPIAPQSGLIRNREPWPGLPPLDLSRLVPPDAHAPSCACPDHRRPPPPAPMPTRAPGPGQRMSR